MGFGAAGSRCLTRSNRYGFIFPGQGQRPKAGFTATTSDGLPGRPWYKHQIYAPGQYTGYSAKTLPAIREAIEQKQWKQAEEAVLVVAGVLQDEAALISSAAGKLAKAK